MERFGSMDVVFMKFPYDLISTGRARQAGRGEREGMAVASYVHCS